MKKQISVSQHLPHTQKSIGSDLYHAYFESSSGVLPESSGYSSPAVSPCIQKGTVQTLIKQMSPQDSTPPSNTGKLKRKKTKRPTREVSTSSSSLLEKFTVHGRASAINTRNSEQSIETIKKMIRTGVDFLRSIEKPDPLKDQLCKLSLLINSLSHLSADDMLRYLEIDRTRGFRIHNAIVQFFYTANETHEQSIRTSLHLAHHLQRAEMTKSSNKPLPKPAFSTPMNAPKPSKFLTPMKAPIPRNASIVRDSSSLLSTACPPPLSDSNLIELVNLEARYLHSLQKAYFRALSNINIRMCEKMRYTVKHYSVLAIIENYPLDPETQELMDHTTLKFGFTPLQPISRKSVSEDTTDKFGSQNTYVSHLYEAYLTRESANAVVIVDGVGHSRRCFFMRTDEAGNQTGAVTIKGLGVSRAILFKTMNPGHHPVFIMDAEQQFTEALGKSPEQILPYVKCTIDGAHPLLGTLARSNENNIIQAVFDAALSFVNKSIIQPYAVLHLYRSGASATIKGTRRTQTKFVGTMPESGSYAVSAVAPAMSNIRLSAMKDSDYYSTVHNAVGKLWDKDDIVIAELALYDGLNKGKIIKKDDIIGSLVTAHGKPNSFIRFPGPEALLTEYRVDKDNRIIKCSWSHVGDPRTLALATRRQVDEMTALNHIPMALTSVHAKGAYAIFCNTFLTLSLFFVSLGITSKKRGDTFQARNIDTNARDFDGAHPYFKDRTSPSRISIDIRDFIESMTTLIQFFQNHTLTAPDTIEMTYIEETHLRNTVIKPICDGLITVQGLFTGSITTVLTNLTIHFGSVPVIKHTITKCEATTDIHELNEYVKSLLTFALDHELPHYTYDNFHTQIVALIRHNAEVYSEKESRTLPVTRDLAPLPMPELSSATALSTMPTRRPLLPALMREALTIDTPLTGGEA